MFKIIIYLIFTLIGVIFIGWSGTIKDYKNRFTYMIGGTIIFAVSITMASLSTKEYYESNHNKDNTTIEQTEIPQQQDDTTCTM